MKILHINTSAGNGGAAKVATDINQKLEKKGINSYLIVNHNNTFLDNIGTFNKHKYNFLSRIFRYGMYKIDELFGLQNTFCSKYNILKNNKYYQKAGIIHFHNLHGNYFKIKDIEKISKDGKKIVWTLHDDWSLTGKCGFALDCKKWLLGCGKCPYKNLYPKIYLDTSKKFWNIKKDTYKKSNFTIISPSIWLKNRVRKSPLMKGKNIKLIYNGIDTNIYKKYKKEEAREQFNLPKNKFIILFIADGGKGNKRKGGQYLNKIINDFQNKKDVYFISIGNKQENIKRNLKEFGYIKDPNILAQLYSASNVFIYPSLADNCPLVVLESLSCGLPVVSFATGGIPEIIEHKQNGYIAEYMDFIDLKKGVEYFKNKPNLDIKLNEKFKIENMVNNYIDLYKKL